MKELHDKPDETTPAAETKEGLALNPIEVRVLASLVEKEMTTPEYYPLTVKALTAACNQKSNRDPVMFLTEAEVMEAVERLRYNHVLVWQVDQAGSRTPKFRHALEKTFKFSPREQAVICELMLRGFQTQGELRTHCARLAEFASLDEVRETLEKLRDREGGGLVRKLPPGPGRREVRYGHLLCREEDRPSPSDPGFDAGQPSASAGRPPQASRVEALEQEVATLRNDLTELRLAFDEFRKQFE